MITHYDLFAGIGGFSYALDQVFYDQEIKHIFCEWEAFPTAVLKKHWPDGTYYGDIADLVADTNSQRDSDGYREVQKEDGEIPQRHNNAKFSNSDRSNDITILTGGFPCQPFSHAGRRKGTSDDRYKWPEMFAVIRNVRPDWVIAENVRGLASWNDGMVLETVCSDLESQGYEVRPYIIPACSVGAPHKRERVWVVGHAKGERGKGEERSICKRENAYDSRSVETTPHTRRKRWIKGVSESIRPKRQESEQSHNSYSSFSWNQDWREVALATCNGRMDDGLPRKLDGATLRGKRTDTISASKHRQERLKACGNAIVPQVAMEIFKSIRATMLQ